jgi:hypothetical protein
VPLQKILKLAPLSWRLCAPGGKLSDGEGGWRG